MDAKKAVHKHEKAMHPGKPLTKLAKGGKTNLILIIIRSGRLAELRQSLLTVMSACLSLSLLRHILSQITTKLSSPSSHLGLLGQLVLKARQVRLALLVQREQPENKARLDHKGQLERLVLQA